jgi:hypothetical protein
VGAWVGEIEGRVDKDGAEEKLGSNVGNVVGCNVGDNVGPTSELQLP